MKKVLRLQQRGLVLTLGLWLCNAVGLARAHSERSDSTASVLQAHGSVSHAGGKGGSASAQPREFWASGLDVPGSGAVALGLGVLLAASTLLFLRSRQQRRKAELEHAHHAAIVANANDAIISKSLTGIVTSWNKAAERIFGDSADEAIGKPLSTLIVPADRQHEEVAILSSIARGEALPRMNALRRRKDGSLLEAA